MPLTTIGTSDSSLTDFEQLQHLLKTIYQQQPAIPLLLDETKQFDIGDIFIDLELIETSSNKTTKPNIQSEIRREFISEMPKNRKQIAPEDLFKPEKNSTGAVQRVFLQGAAGVGKTTLGRYLLHAYASKNVFADQFDLVIYLPLREIVLTYPDTPSLRQVGYSVKDLLLGDWEDSAVFHQKDTWGHRLIDPKHKVALWEFIQKQPHRVLWVLDGLDEVDQAHPAIRAFLHYMPCYLLLSRPQAAPVSIQRHIENAGFREEHIKQYAQNYFALIEQPQLAESFMAALKTHPEIMSFCSIVINCQLFCGAWQELSANPQAMPTYFTMTARYNFAMRQWQKRALRRDTALTTEDWKILTDKDVQMLCEDRMQILRAICLRAIQNEGVLIPGDWLEVAIEDTLQQRQEANTVEHKKQLLKAVLDLGVIRRQGLSEHYFQDRYEVAHLTFMEYLVGEALAQGLSESANTKAFALARDLLKHHQYNSKWAIVWRFVAGHLAKQQNGGLLTFFIGLLEGPQDLFGELALSQLLYCYEEAAPYAMFSNELHSAFLNFFQTWFEHLPAYKDSIISLRLSKAFEQCPILLNQIYRQATIKEAPAIFNQKLFQPSNCRSTISLIRILLILSDSQQMASWHTLLQQRCLDTDYFVRDEAKELLKVLLPHLNTEQLDSCLTLVQQSLSYENGGIRRTAIELLKYLSPQLNEEQIAHWHMLLQQLCLDKGYSIRKDAQDILKILLPRLNAEQMASWHTLLQQRCLDTDYFVRQEIKRILKVLLPYLNAEQLASWHTLLQQGLSQEDKGARQAAIVVLEIFSSHFDDEQLASWLVIWQQGWPQESKDDRQAIIALLKHLSPRLSDEQLASWLTLLQQSWCQEDKDMRGAIIVFLETLLRRLGNEQLAPWFDQVQKEWSCEWWPGDDDNRRILSLLRVLLPRLSDEQLAPWLKLVLKGWSENNSNDYEGEVVSRRAMQLLQVLLPYLNNEQLSPWLTLLNQRWSYKFWILDSWTLFLLQNLLPRLSDEHLQPIWVTLLKDWSNNKELSLYCDIIIGLLISFVLIPLLSNLSDERRAVWLALFQQGWEAYNHDLAYELLLIMAPYLTKEQLVTYGFSLSQTFSDEDVDWSKQLKLLKIVLPNLSLEQLRLKIAILQQCLMLTDKIYDKKEVIEIFTALLPSLHKSQNREIDVNTLLSSISALMLEEMRNNNLILLKYPANTLGILSEGCEYYFKLKSQTIATLQDKTMSLQPPNHRANLKQLCQALLKEADTLQQAHMGALTGHFPRNYIGGFAELKPEHWAVSLVRKKNQNFFNDLTSHVFIILEGIEENREVLLKIHLTADASGKVSIQQEPIQDIDWLKGMSNGNYCYKGWQINQSLKNKLVEIIGEDKRATEQGKLVYNRFGNGGIYRLRFVDGHSYHSCLSWAEEKLKDIGLPMERHWLDTVVTLPHHHLPAPPEAEVTPSKCVIA